MTFTKEQLQHIIETDHVQCGDASALARMALAGMEAEPVAWAHRLINKRNGVVHPWVYGSAEACPSEGDIFNIEVMPLYTAPPAPVSVPDESAVELLATDLMKRIDKITGERHSVATLSSLRVSIVEACRAAVLQGADGNSPVVPDGWVACVERMPSAGEQVLAYRPDAPESNDPLIKMATYVGGSAHGHGFDCYCKPTHWMPLPAAPQQEA